MRIKKPKITKSGIEAEEIEFTGLTLTVFLSFLLIGVSIWLYFPN